MLLLQVWHVALHPTLLGHHNPCGRVRRSQCTHTCSSSKGNVAWLAQTSSPVRQDYDAVIALAGVPTTWPALLSSLLSMQMGC